MCFFLFNSSLNPLVRIEASPIRRYQVFGSTRHQWGYFGNPLERKVTGASTPPSVEKTTGTSSFRLVSISHLDSKLAPGACRIATCCSWIVSCWSKDMQSTTLSSGTSNSLSHNSLPATSRGTSQATSSPGASLDPLSALLRKSLKSPPYFAVHARLLRPSTHGRLALPTLPLFRGRVGTSGCPAPTNRCGLLTWMSQLSLFTAATGLSSLKAAPSFRQDCFDDFMHLTKIFSLLPLAGAT